SRRSERAAICAAGGVCEGRLVRRALGTADRSERWQPDDQFEPAHVGQRTRRRSEGGRSDGPRRSTSGGKNDLADRAAASRCVRRAQCAATRSAAVARNFLSELSAAVRTASDLRSADEGWLPAVLVAASQFRVAVHRSGHARSATAGSLFLAGSACELAKD